MRVDIGGLRLFVDALSPQYVVDGPEMVQRPTLLILHGGPGHDSSGAVREVGRLLADVAHVIVYDHRGNGRSDRRTPDEWCLDVWADDVVRLCDALEIERPFVFGGSFGGLVAQRYGARHPDHAGGLILMATFAHDPDPSHGYEVFRRLGGDEVAEIARRDDEEQTPEVRALWVERCLPLLSRHPDAVPQMRDFLERAVRNPDVEMHFTSGEMTDLDLRGDLARVRCPVLVVAGEDDPVAPPALSEIIAGALPAGQAELHVIPRAGHMVALDAPEALASLIRAFVGR